MDYDADRITYTNQNLAGPGQDDGLDDGSMTAVNAKRQFREFIRSYRNGNLFPYRDQVRVWMSTFLGRTAVMYSTIHAIHMIRCGTLSWLTLLARFKSTGVFFVFVVCGVVTAVGPA